MNKIIKTTLIFAIAIFGVGILFASPTYAQPPYPFVVQFENSPLFSETNFIPGDSVGRWVKATNNTTETLKVFVNSINVNDSDHLGDALYLEIKEGANILYAGTLSTFFGAGEIYLSDLAGNGTQTQYDFNISFNITAENEYQEKTLIFDFKIIARGEEPQSSSGGSLGAIINGSSSGGSGQVQGESTEIQQGEVAGESIIRTSLPETGGNLIRKMAKNLGVSSTGLAGYEINLLSIEIIILILIVVIVLGLLLVRILIKSIE